MTGEPWLAALPSTALACLAFMSLSIGMSTMHLSNAINATAHCQGELFHPSCGANDVIMMTHATYGRIRISRCVKENFGYLGCTSDVIKIMDALCSGRHLCSVKVLDEHFPNIKSCHEDLKAYLEVSYKCIKVITKPRQVCQSRQPIELHETSGYIASVTTTETGCGTADAPWIIEALPGQKVNITLIDFGIWRGNLSGEHLQDSFSRVCRVYATIRESHGSRSVTVCGGESRERTVYISQQNRVEVRLISTKTTNKPANFLLHYQVTGCPDVETPSGGWMKRSEHVALLGCDDNAVTWQIKCEGSTWVGKRRNCTEGPLKVTKSEEFSLASLPLGVSIVIVVVLALVIGLLILAIGIFCLRRNHPDEDDDPYQETQSIMLGDRIYEHAQREPKQTIVCSMHSAPRAATTTQVTRLHDAKTRENDYSGTRMRGSTLSVAYTKEHNLNRAYDHSQCLDILHSPNIIRQHGQICNGNTYQCSAQGRVAEHAQYCDDPEVHYEAEKSKLLGLEEQGEPSIYCDSTNQAAIYSPAKTSKNNPHCNKCGLKTFGAPELLGETSAQAQPDPLDGASNSFEKLQ